MKLINLLNKLPIELIYKIRKNTYNYNLQPIILLIDIKDYYKTKKSIELHYHNVYNPDLFEPTKDKQWLINDLAGFLNNNIALMINIDSKFINTLFRLYCFKNQTIIINKIKSWCMNNKINVNTEINIYWGAMIPSERKIFINKILE